MSRLATARLVFAFALLLLFPSLLANGQSVFFVDADATGSKSGVSWADAFVDLQSALQIAGFGDEIWVAEGVYKPVVPVGLSGTTDVEKSKSFRILDGVGVYGGFSGTESALTERNVELHVTVLSGDLLGDDNDNIRLDEPSRIDNTWRIVKMGDIDLGTVGNNTILDGFTITGGNANPPPLNSNNAGAGIDVLGFDNNPSSPVLSNLKLNANSAEKGGAIDCISASPTLRNIVVENNFAVSDGGGMWSFKCNADMRHVRFERNIAGDTGGGIFNNRGQSYMIDVRFIENEAARGGGAANLLDTSMYLNVRFHRNRADSLGGGMHNDESKADIMNTIFSGNSTSEPAPYGGGGFYNHQSSPLNPPWMTNNTFSGNTTAGNGGAILSSGGTARITNSIMWGNHADSDGNEIFANNNLGR